MEKWFRREIFRKQLVGSIPELKLGLNIFAENLSYTLFYLNDTIIYEGEDFESFFS